MSKTKTFVDANILIAAFQGKDELSLKAMQILDDPEREFVVSDYLRLEVVPAPTFHRRDEEVEFMQTFLDEASHQASPTPSITARALDMACRYNLHPVDALHIGVAVELNADVLITLEKPEKPLCQVREVKVTSLRS
jgi:predicted nucleic acid-binding protein